MPGIFEIGLHTVLLANGAFLYKTGLRKIKKYLSEHPRTDLIYTDIDITEPSGRKIPFFKPDYSADLLLSVPYFGSPLIVKTALLRKIKVLPASNPAWLWDLALKATELVERIVHLPIVAASQKIMSQLPPSGWPVPDEKTHQANQRVLASALKKRGISAWVLDGPFAGSYRIKYQIHPEKVSIIISTKDKTAMLNILVQKILRESTYRNFEIIIVNNNSTEIESKNYFKQIAKNKKVIVKDYSLPFNIAAIFNYAARRARGKYLLFMGNDTEPITKDWLEVMLGHFQRQNVGVVGSLLLYPDKTIQHCGVVLGYGSAPDKSDHVAGHPYGRFPLHPGYFGTILLQRNFSAVTGAVMLTSKKLYQKLGGYDGKNLPTLFNDVDYCLRVGEAGYKIVYEPNSVLYHKERASLGKQGVDWKMDPKEIQYMRRKWHQLEDNDPFYNPNLTLEKQDFTLNI